MSTLSVPLSAEQEAFIEMLVKQKKAANKADAVRRAIELMAEEEAISAVLQAEKELGEGKVLRGDLRELAKKFK